MVNLFFDYLLEIFKRSLMLSRPLRVFGLTRAETIPQTVNRASAGNLRQWAKAWPSNILWADDCERCKPR